MKVVVTGASGKLGRLVAQDLVRHGHDVVGIDRRPWPDAPKGFTLAQTDVRKREAEEVFRSHKPKAAIHMATVTHFQYGAEDRYRINLGGTRAFFRHCEEQGVEHAVFVGRHTFYGAAADAPLYHSEDEPPLGIHTFAELADLVAADLYAGSMLWRLPNMQTSVLRVCYTLGPSRHGTLADYLRGPRVPTVLGFDPLFQFMHEYDAARAIGAALEAELRGVFNVAGPPPLPLSTLIRATGRQGWPLPEPMFPYVVGHLGLPKLPRGAVQHLKYATVVDGSRFVDATGFCFENNETATMMDFAAS